MRLRRLHIQVTREEEAKMALYDHVADDRDYAVHEANYRKFLHVLWSCIGAAAFVLIMLDAIAG